MSKHKGVFLLAVLIVAALLVSTVTYQVDELKDIVLVKRFYRVVGPPMKGTDDAGIKVKWPWPIETIVRYDSRESILEDPYEQVLTSDNQSVILNMFCNWRIANAVALDRRVPSVQKAQESLRALLKSIKGNVIVQYRMSDIINTDPRLMKLSEIEDRILADLKKQAMESYGIEVTRVGVKVLGLTEGISEAVIDNQIKERQQEAENYRSAGDAQATAIIKRASAASSEILAFAQRRASNIRTEGVRDAARYYGTFKQNERLSMFLRSLDSLRKEMASRTVIILDSSQNPAVDFFQNGPSLENMKVPATAPANNPHGN